MCNTPEDLNLEGIDTVAIDIETYDPNLKTKGSGAKRKDGFICGIAVATKKETAYFPLRHSDTDTEPSRIQNIWDVLNQKIFQNKNIKLFFNFFYLFVSSRPIFILFSVNKFIKIPRSDSFS